MKNTLERILPKDLQAGERNAETLRLHLERYRYAADYILPGAVADMACGVGYGSHYLASTCMDHVSHIWSIDRSVEAIDFAKEHYHHPLVSYLIDDVQTALLPKEVKTVVSLETIEHLPHPEAFLKNLAQHLPDKGRLIVSVPVTPSMDGNPYHLHDFTVASFLTLMQEHGFRPLHYFIQEQPYGMFPVLFQTEQTRRHTSTQSLWSFYLNHPQKLWLRLRSLFTDGLRNKYLVGAFEKHS